MEAKLKGLPDSDVTKLVNDAISTVRKETSKTDMATTTDEKNNKSAEFKAVEDALANRVASRLKNGGYMGPYRHPLTRDLYDQVESIYNYHDMVLGYEL